MDSLEAIQLPTSRTFWNSHDPSLDPFDENLVPTMASDPLEACSSTFLFPSTSSTCDESDDSRAIFKLTRPSHQQTSIFEDNPVEGGAESNLATAQSYCPNADPGSMTPSSQFSWTLPASPHYHPQGVGGGNSQGQVHYGVGLGPDFFGPLNSNIALESGHGIENQAFLKVPLMRQPSFRQLGANAKASWQSSADVFQPNMSSFEQSRRVSHKDQQPLGSPCSVISGFTKALQSVEPVCNDYTMETSCGPSTSAVHGHEGKYESPATARESVTQSMSGTNEKAGGVMNHVATKRKRSKAPKHSNEVESQRMTHIAVERNRRKQMNEHLAALRALMPGSYVQKGDQASIVGGAIEFVKELEHLLHCLQSQKRRRAYNELTNAGTPTSRLAMPNPDQQLGQLQPPFSFHSPQRLVDQSPFLVGASTETQLGNARHPQISSNSGMNPTQVPVLAASPALLGVRGGEVVGEAKSDTASVEVRMVGSEQAMVKIMALRRTGQLLRTVVALESLALTVMHTNITTVHHTVLYSFHVQIGPLCRMNQDEIAAAVHQTFSSLHSLQF